MRPIIDTQATPFDAGIWGYTVTRLIAALDRFHPRLGQVTVRLKNFDGLHLERETSCEIVVEITGEGLVFISETTQTLYGAISGATQRLTIAVARRLDQTRSRRHAARHIPVR